MAEVGHHLKLVLVLTAVEQGAGTIAEICDVAHGSWSEVETLVGELVELGKLERVHDVVRRVGGLGGAD